MEIRPIRPETDDAAGLNEIARLMAEDPLLGTPDGDRLDVLTTLIQADETRHYPILPPDPVEAIRFSMEQRGLTVADMRSYLGPPHRVDEVLSLLILLCSTLLPLNTV